ncbi:MAG: DUF4350 domain-containing protein [Streptosporangiales bacterium]
MTASTALGPTGRGTWRASRPMLVSALALVAVIAVSLLVTFSQQPNQEALSTESAAPDGTRALAELLDDRGVTVHESDDPHAAADDATASTTLVLADTVYLTDKAAHAVAASAADLVLIRPASTRLAEITDRVEQSGSNTQDSTKPGCSLHVAVRAGRAELGGATYKLTGSRAGAIRCYRSDDGFGLVRLRDSGRTITVIGSTLPFLNEHLDEQGNAALALNLLGAHEDLTWLLPDPESSGGVQTGSFSDLIAYPVRLSLFGLVVAVVLLAFARGRRLGPVVSERLPVVVRAAETTEGRARLYRSLRARPRAAGALRGGTISRLRRLLGLPRRTEPVAVVAAITSRTGREPANVHALLYGDSPDDDAGLVRLADELDTLEGQVRRS